MATAIRANQTDELSDADVLDRAEEIVDDFLIYVRRETIRNDILDVNVLPVSKTTLANAFRLVIATESRPEYRRALVKAGLLLSRFQQNIGARISLVPVGAQGSETFSETPRPHGEQQHERIDHIDRAFALAEPDAQRLMTLFEQSIRIAERRARHVSPRPPQPDGTYTWHEIH